MTDEVFRFIVQGNTADDLPRFDTEVDLQFQQFFSLRNFFASYDFTDAESILPKSSMVISGFTGS